jgi:hypothetical protein
MATKTQTQVETAEDQGLDFGATLRELRKNVDPSLVRQREGWRDRNGNAQMVDYVEWHTVADILDDTAPDWQFAIRDLRVIGDIAVCTAAITIGGITREGIGTGNALNDMGIKKAEHDALKRAGVKFGIARDLYKKEFDAHDSSGGGGEPSHTGGGNYSNGGGGRTFQSTPIADMQGQAAAQGLSDLVSAKQLGMIRAISREAGVDAEEECMGVLNCSTSELSKKAASSFIDHLLKIQRSVNQAPPPLRRAD